jgi:hypothetical protein
MRGRINKELVMDYKKTIILNNGCTLISIDNRVNKGEINSDNQIIEFSSEGAAVYTDLSKDDCEDILKIIDLEKLEYHLKARNFFDNSFDGKIPDKVAKINLLPSLDHCKTIILNNGHTIITVANKENKPILNSDNLIIKFLPGPVTKQANPFDAVYKNLTDEDCVDILKIIDLEGLEGYLKARNFFG